MESIIPNLSDKDFIFKEEIDNIILTEVAPYINDVEQGKIDIWDVLRRLGKHGLIGITYPKEFGGYGGTYTQELLMTEALCYQSYPMDMSRGSSTYPASLIRIFGKTKILRKYIDPLVKGEKIGSFCFTEPDAGSDLSRMKTMYQKDEKNDEFILNGEKRFITNGSVADTLVVYARNGAFIVQSDWDGFEVIEEYSMMGLHGLHLGHLKFNNVRIPKENELFYREPKPSTEGTRKRRTEAISSMQQFLAPERVMMALQAISVAKRALDEAIRYSRERVQFNRPISEFEGISFKVAEMATNYEAGKALVQKSLQNMNDGALAAMSKLFACTNAFKICDDALQVLGGIGYTNKYPVERCLRDIRLSRIGGGTDEIMKYIIQKDIYKKLK